MSRRSMLVHVCALLLWAAGPLRAQGRPLLSSAQVVEVQGQSLGLVRSATGGYVVGEVAEETTRVGAFVAKTLAHVRYTDIVLEVDHTQIGVFLEAFLAMRRLGGAISILDTRMREVLRREFAFALVTEIQFPALDAASKDPAVFVVRLTPEFVWEVQPSGEIAAQGLKANKGALVSHFRITVPGLDTAHVTAVSPIILTATQALGGTRDQLPEPAELHLANFAVTVAQKGSETWKEWHTDFVVRGNYRPQFERTLTWELLSPDLGKTLVAVQLGGVGIFSLTYPGDSGNDTIATVQAGLYAETLGLLPSIPPGSASLPVATPKVALLLGTKGSQARG